MSKANPSQSFVDSRSSMQHIAALASLIILLAAQPCVAQFQPPIGSIATPLTLNVNSPVTHTSTAGTFKLTRQVLDSGNTIRYTVDRPTPLADVVFERTRPFGSNAGFNVTAAFIGRHGLLFVVFDANNVNRQNTAVFLNLSQTVPVAQNLYSRQDFATSNPNPQFFRNGAATDASTATCLFTPVFNVNIAGNDTFELSVFRVDTGAQLCSLGARNRQTNDSFQADILDNVGGNGISDTVRVRHNTSSGPVDQNCSLPPLAQPRTTRISVAAGGVQANNESRIQFAGPGAISADGRFVAFHSFATNLVAGDTNAQGDVFVHDRSNATTTRVSVDSNGVQSNGSSVDAVISADGRFVAFRSRATNLVAGDTNSVDDIFVHDRTTKITTRASVSSGGVQGNAFSLEQSISADGRFVAFSSNATNLVADDTNSTTDVFVLDRATGTTTRVSLGPGGTQVPDGNGCTEPSISADGRFVAFISRASNLVAGDTNGVRDVFMRDRTNGTTARLSVGPGGTQTDQDSRSPAISADGRFVAFRSRATNLVAGDTNLFEDIFVRDRTAGTTSRVSVSSGGVQTNQVSSTSGISADGRFVAFISNATNLVTGDTNNTTDVFVRDRTTGSTSRISVSSGGIQGNVGGSGGSSISADGRFVAFHSRATNLVAGDTNSREDVFIRDRGEAAVGTFDLSPSNPTVAIHERVEVALTWTVPDPLNWHDLESLQLRVRDDSETVISVFFDEATQTFALVDESSGEIGIGWPAGSNKRLQTPRATLHLGDTSVSASGPTSPSVTLHLSLSFKAQLAGELLSVEVAATDDEGNHHDFEQGGTLTILN